MSKILQKLLVVSLVVIFSGCALLDKLMPAPDPQTVIKEMVTKMLELSAAQIDLTAKINGAKPQDQTTVAADVALQGTTNFQKKEAPQVDLGVKLGVKTTDKTQGQMEGTADLKVKITDQNVFINLENVVLPQELQKQVDPILATYKGIWYKFPAELIPDQIKNKINKTPEELQKEEQVKKLIRETQFFEIVESASENNQFVYTAKINPTNYKTFLQEMGKIEGKPVETAALDQMVTDLNKLQYTVKLYINQTSRYLEEVQLDLKTTDATQGDMAINATLKLSNFDQVAAVTAPENVKDFDPMALMSMAAMLEGSQGTDLNTPSTDNGAALKDISIPATTETGAIIGE